jgi:hypothetical protein
LPFATIFLAIAFSSFTFMRSDPVVVGPEAIRRRLPA